MKRFGSIALAMAMLVSLVVLPVGAVADEEKLLAVQALGIMVGDNNGDMQLGKVVTRAEFITMMVRANPSGDTVNKTAAAPFPDVPAGSWYAPFVAYGVQHNYTTGYSDGSFRPSAEIPVEQGVSMVLRLLGYSAQHYVGGFPHAQMALGDQIGLLDGMTATDIGDILTRDQAMKLIYNALIAPSASGQPYLTLMGYPLTAQGTVDVTAVVNMKMDGPTVATGNWQSGIDVNWNTVTVKRDGKTISANQIAEYDVLYWSKSMNTIWVYSDRVTGTVQSIMPSTSAPTSVMVAGQNYGLGSASAAYALSNLGEYGVGDVVTLLFGRDGTVVSVMDGMTVASSRVGLVTAMYKASYENGSYTADTISILSTDGKTYSYPASSTYLDVGDMVRVSAQSGGGYSVTRVSGGGVSGTVSADGTKIGATKFASNVEIVEYNTDTNAVKATYPSRLAGMSISSSDVLCVLKNDDGEITTLALQHITGDMDTYVVVTEEPITIPSMSGGFTSVYSLVVAGQEMPLQIVNARYTKQAGPAAVEGSLEKPTNVKSLVAVDVDYISGQTVYDGAKSYTMADDVQIYEKDGKDYYLTTLERANDAGLTLNAYRDDGDGSRVRVIVAEK